MSVTMIWTTTAARRFSLCLAKKISITMSALVGDCALKKTPFSDYYVVFIDLGEKTGYKLINKTEDRMRAIQ